MISIRLKDVISGQVDRQDEVARVEYSLVISRHDGDEQENRERRVALHSAGYGHVPQPDVTII